MRSTSRASGYASENHGGGEAVGVARSMEMPPACSSSTISSIPEKSKRSCSGSIQDHEKTPRVTRLTPACRISRMSSFHTSRFHWSGL